MLRLAHSANIWDSQGKVSKVSLKQALERFERAETFEQMSEVSAPLLTTAGAAVAAKDSRFALGLGRLHSIALEGGEEQERLSALALAWRLTAIPSMNAHRRSLILAQKSMDRPLEASPTALKLPEDRNYLAEALKHVRGDWLPGYLARAIAEEGVRSTVIRRTFSEAFVASTSSIVQQLQILTEFIASTRLAVQDPESARARLFAASLDGLEAANWRALEESPVGEDFATAFSEFCSKALLRGSIEDRDSAITAASAALKFARTVARLHSPFAGEAENYRFLGPLKRLFRPSGRPDEILVELDQVARQVGEQLVLLTRQDKPDRNLRNIYIQLQGSVRAKLQLRSLADRATGLAPEFRLWLESGIMPTVTEASGGVDEMAIAQIDRDLAMAFRDSAIGEALLYRHQADIVAAADAALQPVGKPVRDLFSRVERVLSLVQSMARRRRLSLRGAVGEMVEFAPAEHSPEADAIGERLVTLRNKLVERVVDGRSVEIILKADVGRS